MKSYRDMTADERRGFDNYQLSRLYRKYGLASVLERIQECIDSKRRIWEKYSYAEPYYDEKRMGRDEAAIRRALARLGEAEPHE